MLRGVAECEDEDGNVVLSRIIVTKPTGFEIDVNRFGINSYIRPRFFPFKQKKKKEDISLLVDENDVNRSELYFICKWIFKIFDYHFLFY